MSCAPRQSCTECHVECRTADVRHFSMCQHRICKNCLASRGPASQTRRGSAIAREICPVCDENRRRLSVQVRTGIWTDQLAKVECVECSKHGPGTLMKCGHSYCAPCLRKQPRSTQSRSLDGNMAKGCMDCEKKAAEEFRDAARAAMRYSEEEARMARDERETREFRRDAQLLKPQSQRQELQQAQQAKQQQPKKAAKGPVVTIPVGPSFLDTDDSGRTIVAKPVWRKMPKPSGVKQQNVAAAPVRPLNGVPDEKVLGKSTKAARRVSFDPLVQQRIISPLPAKRGRHSMPAAGFPAGAASSASSSSSSSSRSSRASTAQSLLFGAAPQSMFALPPRSGWSASGSSAYASAAGLRLSSTPSWLTDSSLSSACEPRTPTNGHRTFSRGWGITTP